MQKVLNLASLLKKKWFTSTDRRTEKMYLIVGLGNPGKQYEATRHNMGFDTVDYLIEKHNIPQSGVKFP